MAKYKGVIEDKYFKQHQFEVEGGNQKEAEAEAIRKVAYDNDKSYSDLEVLSCVEMLTEEQAEAYEKNTVTVADLEIGDKFIFNDFEFEVKVPFGKSTDEFGNSYFSMLTTNEEVFYSAAQPVERI
uniref:Uncharacterized protein n=1 Tax=Tanacetum cinerariifolium TaxID=118510 RepID=A0A699HVN6_TANCI|nr:hypothetical protein [Tanacetum cinerariifolium]